MYEICIHSNIYFLITFHPSYIIHIYSNIYFLKHTIPPIICLLPFLCYTISLYPGLKRNLAPKLVYLGRHTANINSEKMPSVLINYKIGAFCKKKMRTFCTYFVLRADKISCLWSNVTIWIKRKSPKFISRNDGEVESSPAKTQI